VVTPDQIETVVKKSVPHTTKGTTVSPTSISRFSRIEPARRLLLLVAIMLAAFAMASIGHISGASAEPVGDDGITIDCSLGGGEFVPPGTMINLPAAGDLPAVVVVCGNDGRWHVSANIVKRTSPRLLSPPVVAQVMQLRK
jgi:hypothetical protein